MDKFCGKKIPNCFAIPSGIVVTVASSLSRLFKEGGPAILISKSIGIKPRKGNPTPIIAGRGDCSFINAVGLANPGVDEFLKQIRTIEVPKNKVFIVSIFGKDLEEFTEIGKKLYPYVDGFEINISCPHSEGFGLSIGQDKDLVAKITKNVVSFKKPVFVKISPSMSDDDIREIVKIAEMNGAYGITATNTKGPEQHLHNGFPVLYNKVGGVSGLEIQASTLRCIRLVREVTQLKIIGCGGFSDGESARKALMAGADYIAIGSALAGMSTKEIIEYFSVLKKDLIQKTNKSIRFLKKDLMKYQRFSVSNIRFLAEDLFTLELNENIGEEMGEIKPGQFVFVWIPEITEKPFSVYKNKPLTLLVQKRGCFTGKLSELKIEDDVYIRGPYGKSLEIKNEKTLLVVCGGTGVAILPSFAKQYKTIALIGVKDEQHLVDPQYLNDICSKVYFVTENGQNKISRKGMVTDVLEQVIKTNKIDVCINCGPEAMVKVAMKIQQKYFPSTRTYGFIERRTECGIGLCGKCADSQGSRSCVDGPYADLI